MASLGAPASPNSCQLRRCALLRSSPDSISRFSPFFLRNIRPLNWRTRASSVAGNGDQKADGRSWMGPEKSSAETFSGWSESGSGSRKEHQGRLGGAAGIILTAGIALASLSLGKKSNVGLKEQMKPLTVQQEAILQSEDRNEVDQAANKCNSRTLDENDGLTGQSLSGSESNTGTTKDSFPSEEYTEASSESRNDVVTSTQTFENDNSESDVVGLNDVAVVSDEMEKQVQLPSGVEEFSALPYSTPGAPDLSATVNDEGPDTSSLKTTSKEESPEVENIDTRSGNVSSNVSKKSIGSIYPTNFTMPDSDQATSPEEPIVTEKIEHSNLHFNVSGPSDNELCQGTLPSESSSVGSVVHETSSSESIIVVSSPTSSEQNAIELNDSTPQFPVNDVNATITARKVEAANSLESLHGNAPYPNGFSETDRSSSFGVSRSPENAFSHAGIPAPSLVSAALQVTPGKVVVPPIIDQVQGQALAALQVLKVIDTDVQPGDLCTRREYARWLVAASSALSRNSVSKVYPAMYIENVTDLAFDDVTPQDPDFTSIQGLAEAGLISSKLSSDGEQDNFSFSPNSPLSRQDLVSWKMAIEKRQLPEVDKKTLYQHSGFIDIDRISPHAWPALMADISAGEHGITALAFGYTRLFQPDKPVTKAQAAMALAIGDAAEVVAEELARIEAESLADTAVAAHSALVAQVEKDLHAVFEKQLVMEREKIAAVEKLAEEATLELEKIKAERNEENSLLLKGRAAIESEMEVLSKLRHEVEEQLQSLMSDKIKISLEQDRLNKLREEAEDESQAISKLQYELEVERKALSMARAWAEDEAKRAREHAKALEEARYRWERRGIKVVVDSELQDDAATELTWLNADAEKLSIEQSPMKETINRGENLVRKLEILATEVKGKSFAAIKRIIDKIKVLIEHLKVRAAEAANKAREVKSSAVSTLKSNAEDLSRKTASSVSNFSSTVKDGMKRLTEECKEGMDRISQKFKM
ncbi:unnamed protein product [Victoria cruziana]